MKLFFVDLETTGTDYTRHGIHQISGFVAQDAKVMESFNYRVRPHKGCTIDPQALEIGGVKEEDFAGYPEMPVVYQSLQQLLGRYVNKYSRLDKYHLVGYNIAAFDSPFLRKWFERNADQYFGSWFWSAPLDVMVLAADYLKRRRHDLPNFQLRTVATTLGLQVDETRLHDAMYDIELTRSIYHIVARN